MVPCRQVTRFLSWSRLEIQVAFSRAQQSHVLAEGILDNCEIASCEDFYFEILAAKKQPVQLCLQIVTLSISDHTDINIPYLLN